MQKYNKLCLSCKNDCKQYAFAKVIECPNYKYNGTSYKNEKDNVKDLTGREKQKIKALVQQCANYSKEYNICLPLDTVCYMLNKATVNTVNCKYFEKAVLPLDRELERLVIGNKEFSKYCSVCGLGFVAKGSQKYCSPKCRTIGTRNMEKAKKRNQRKKEG